ncbi:hypothetical protein BDR26DRAFT_857496 [Obelidium mucronatum]|nr:hypothetical protein BDR26DRAFT_857496 [Obelidium mucronatum]
MEHQFHEGFFEDPFAPETPPLEISLLWSFVKLASPIISKSADKYLRARRDWSRRFASFFGLSVMSACDLWVIVKPSMVSLKLTKTHFLWGLYYLKVYPTESVAAATLGTSETNWRTKVKAVVNVFAECNQIEFEDRWIRWDILDPSMYVDGVDVPVTEARPLDKRLYSHKFKRAGYRFQVATAIGTSRIVFIGGGTPCGINNDLDQVQQTLLKQLEPDEKVAADRGYVGDVRVVTKMKGVGDAVRKHNRNWTILGARHETVNKRMKDFGILAGMFRGRRKDIVTAFCAVAQITNVKLRREPLFDAISRLQF